MSPAIERIGSHPTLDGGEAPASSTAYATTGNETASLYSVTTSVRRAPIVELLPEPHPDWGRVPRAWSEYWMPLHVYGFAVAFWIGAFLSLSLAVNCFRLWRSLSPALAAVNCLIGTTCAVTAFTFSLDAYHSVGLLPVQVYQLSRGLPFPVLVATLTLLDRIFSALIRPRATPGSIKHRKVIVVGVSFYFLAVGASNVSVSTSPELRTWLLPIQAVSVAWGFSASFLVIFQCARLTRYGRTTATARRQITAYVRARRQLELRQKQPCSINDDERNATADDPTSMTTTQLRRVVTKLRVERTKTDEQRQLEELQRQVTEDILAATVAMADDDGIGPEVLAATEVLSTWRNLKASTTSTEETDAPAVACYDNGELDETGRSTVGTPTRDHQAWLQHERRSLQLDVTCSTNDDGEFFVPPTKRSSSLKRRLSRQVERRHRRRRRRSRQPMTTSGKTSIPDNDQSSTSANSEATTGRRISNFRSNELIQFLTSKAVDNVDCPVDDVSDIRTSTAMQADSLDVRTARNKTVLMADNDVMRLTTRNIEPEGSESLAENEDVIDNRVEQLPNHDDRRTTSQGSPTPFNCVRYEVKSDSDENVQHTSVKISLNRQPSCSTSSFTPYSTTSRNLSNLTDDQRIPSSSGMAMREISASTAVKNVVDVMARKTRYSIPRAHHRLRHSGGKVVSSSTVTSLLQRRNRLDNDSSTIVTLKATVDGVSMPRSSPSKSPNECVLRCLERLGRHHQVDTTPLYTGGGSHESVEVSPTVSERSLVVGDEGSRRVPNRHWLGQWTHRRRRNAASEDRAPAEVGAQAMVFQNDAFDLRASTLTLDTDDDIEHREVDVPVDLDTSVTDVDVTIIDDYDADAEVDALDDDDASTNRNQSSPTTTITAEVRLPFPIVIAFPGCLGLRRLRHGRRIRLIARVSYVTLTSAMCACVLNVYAMLGLFSVLSNVRPAAPWTWLAFQTLSRFIELVYFYSMIVITWSARCRHPKMC